jgi:hypothetical protein
MARDIYEDHDELAAGTQNDPVTTILVVLSTLTLLLAIYMVQKALADHFGAGMLADKAPPATAPVTPTP